MNKLKMLLPIAIVCAATVSTVNAQPVEVITTQHKTIGSNDGRFVFGQISKMRRDQFMLDTETGRLWQIVADKNNNISLQLVPYQLVNGKMDVTPGLINRGGSKMGVGRFAFGQISKMRRDQFMLDTKTGRLWQIVADKKENISLQPISYQLLSGKKSVLPEK